MVLISISLLIPDCEFIFPNCWPFLLPRPHVLSCLPLQSHGPPLLSSCWWSSNTKLFLVSLDTDHAGPCHLASTVSGLSGWKAFLSQLTRSYGHLSRRPFFVIPGFECLACNGCLINYWTKLYLLHSHSLLRRQVWRKIQGQWDYR